MTTNIQSVVNSLQAKLLSIADKNNVVRTVAATLAPEVRKRIHEKGQAADGGNIGSYSEDYFKYTRKKYNRTEPKNKKVISLTRKLENEFTSGSDNPNPTKTALGYGIGFISNESFRIAGYQEEQTEKKIWELTKEERALVKTVAEGEVHKILIKK